MCFICKRRFNGRNTERIHRMCGRHPDFFYIDMKRNGGLSSALKAGFDYCFFGVRGYMDADMQTDADDFNLLLPGLLICEFVTGICADRKDSFFKKPAIENCERLPAD